MRIQNLFKSLTLTPARRRSIRRHSPASQLSVESLDDRIVPSTLSASNAMLIEGNAGAATAALIVTLDVPTNKSVTVNYNTADGTAAAGSDYVATSGTLTFAPGVTSKSIPIPVIGDRLPESDEYFVVKLSGARNAKIAHGLGVITIVDDEPRVTINNVNQPEGNSGTTPFTFTVSLSAAYDQPVTVSYATADGTATTADNDYLATSGTLTFALGVTTKTIVVPVIGDRLPEADETFCVNLSGASANARVTQGAGVATIVDDEPRLSIAGGWSQSENYITFSVTLAAAYDEAVTVNFATRDGTAVTGEDYQATSGTLTFAPGETTKTITVLVRVGMYSDPAIEPAEENFYVTLSGASANTMIVQGEAAGTILGPPEPINGDLYGGW